MPRYSKSRKPKRSRRKFRTSKPYSVSQQRRRRHRSSGRPLLCQRPHPPEVPSELPPPINTEVPAAPQQSPSPPFPPASDNDFHNEVAYQTTQTLQVPDKPPKDTKEYRVITLANNTKVVLISEPKKSQEQDFALPYISHSGNVYVGQNSSDKPNGGCHGRTRAHDFCANCSSKDFWSLGFEDPALDKLEESLDFSSFGATPSLPVRNDYPFAASNKDAGSGQMISCAISVGSGYLDEPPKYGGLAHFCEHMVFLGSAKHPGENDFMSLVRLHGGQLNACTMPEHTHYYYSILNVNEVLDKTLDIFTNFFVQPTFDLEAIKREIKALDHEFRMKRPNDMVCRLEILKQGIHPGHPMKNFFWGDQTTLGGCGTEAHYRDLREHLARFHKTHYVGSNICIALQGALSLDELETIALRHFSKIQSGPKPSKEVPSHLAFPFKTPEFNKRYLVKPVGSMDALYLTWALPQSAWQNYRTKPLVYLSSMISSAVEGGLANFLQSHNWIMGEIQCGLQLMAKTKYGVLFVIKLWLTTYGLQYENEIIKTVFAYLNTLEKSGVKQQVFERMKFVRQSNLANYGNYRSQLANAKKLAYSLHVYPPKDINYGDSLFYDFNETAIMNVLQQLKPQNLNVMLFSCTSQNQEFPMVEPNTLCKFDSENFKPQHLHAWTHTNSTKFRFKLPTGPNPYMTTDFTKLNHRGSSHPVFTKLAENEKLSATFVPVSLPIPFGYYHINFDSPAVFSGTAAQKAGVQLMTRMIQCALQEQMGLAEEAGILGKIQPGPDGKIHALVYGYDNMSTKLMNQMINIMSRRAQVFNDEALFAISKEYLLKMIHSMLIYPAYLAQNLLYRSWKWGDNSMLDLHSALIDMNFQCFQNFYREYFSEMKITLLAIGNSSVNDVQSMVKSLDQIDYRPISPRQNTYEDMPRMVTMPNMNIILRVSSLNPVGSTSNLITYFQFARANIKDYLLGFSLLRMMSQPMFSELRTHKSLGYAIESGMVAEGNVLGALLSITSDEDRFSMDQLDKEVDNFIVKFYAETLNHIRNNEFQDQLVNITGMKMDMITLEDMQAFYMAYLMPGENSSRKKLSIQVSGHETDPEADDTSTFVYNQKLRITPIKPANVQDRVMRDNLYFVDNIDEFQSLCSLYPVSSAI